MSTASYSVALASAIHAQAAEHLLRRDGQEDLCFAIWYPSYGRTRQSALLHRLVLPFDGERQVHGNASFEARYFERAVIEAAIAEGGLAFLHSHPAPGWQDMSGDDIRAEQGHAAAAKGATGLPLIGLTLGTDGAWSGRFWEKVRPRTYERRWCSTVRVVGEQLRVTYMNRLLTTPRLKEELKRTVSAWGQKKQSELARLRVGVVGLGNVGSIIVEALARIGIQHVVLIDFDTIEFVNLDRVLHATTSDVLLHRAKAEVIARAIRSSATADDFQADEVTFSIAEEEGFRAALDCDVLFSCVDRPLARSVLNFIAYAHMIPVVDGGIQIQSNGKMGLRRADWKAHIAGPGRRCLECLEQYDPGLVQADRDGFLDDPTYISGLPVDHPIRQNENVFAFSLSAASFEILQMLMMVVAPCGFANAAEQNYHFVPGIFDEPGFHTCVENCLYPRLVARGEATDLVVAGRHKTAEAIRSARNAARRSIPWRTSFADLLQRGISRLATALVQSSYKYSYSARNATTSE